MRGNGCNFKKLLQGEAAVDKDALWGSLCWFYYVKPTKIASQQIFGSKVLTGVTVSGDRTHGLGHGFSLLAENSSPSESNAQKGPLPYEKGL
jgi:hypothetical protein